MLQLSIFNTFILRFSTVFNYINFTVNILLPMHSSFGLFQMDYVGLTSKQIGIAALGCPTNTVYTEQLHSNKRNLFFLIYF